MYNMIEYNTTYAILYIMYYMLYYYLSKNVRNPESMFMLPIQMCPKGFGLLCTVLVCPLFHSEKTVALNNLDTFLYLLSPMIGIE